MVFSHARLLWTAEWHLRDETCQATLACLPGRCDPRLAVYPFTALWGEGDTSSADGQFFRAGGHGEARANHNAHYGSELVTKFYTYVPTSPTGLRRSTPRSLRLTQARHLTFWMASSTMKAPWSSESRLRDLADRRP